MNRSRLFLITPPLAEAARFAPLLETAVGAVDIACVLLRLAACDPGTAKGIVRGLAPIAQARGTAVLVEDDARLAVRAEADGVHLTTADASALGEAIAALQPGRIVGAGGLADRDAAMRAGEAGVDYVMFEGAQGLEMAGWWTEIFNVPCVAVAPSLAEVAALSREGVEFVALGEGVWDSPATIATTLREAEAMLAPLAEPVR